MTDGELISLLDASDGRTTDIVILRDAGWTFVKIAQALGTTKNACISAWHKRARRMKRARLSITA